ncbi:alkaline phosphatase D [Aquimarina amphilecti]|uniref:Alkaline phosphatase D n=1 Tax=Aquimarina amphilecti TaxID=1038014 RepID=A0A1H7TMG4_AQUAM|nr:alkaline phosphatase D family protein [Aquimarina amphilecti]SEL85546.1 alkaline phosphatase D [Aquimarina amphilecti]
MKLQIYLVFFLLFIIKYVSAQETQEKETVDFVIAFGSCNKQNSPQPFWEEILKNKPNVFIWGGDNIYGDSDDMSKIADDYKIQNSNFGYQKLKSKIPIMATWDDHDYGKNDVGVEWHKKKESQQLFLDFIGVAKDDKRRIRDGIYTSQLFETPKGTIKVIILDTRYFRGILRKDITGKKRYLPHENNNETILGEKQWVWLEKELKSSNADFHILVSSIQFLSGEHGWESWANFPDEVLKLQELISETEVKNCLILSGDRHISEFSKKDIPMISYPLVDFTSSGLTHAYTKYSGEPNRYRTGKVIAIPSFGVLRFDFDRQLVTMQMRGTNNAVLQEIKQEYLKK